MLCIFLLATPSMVRPLESFQDKQILVLHSYGPDYTWTINLNEGISSVFSQLDWTNTVRYEYMDTKNIIGEEYTEALRKIYKQKYENARFDAILATDNNALLFLESYGRELFGEIPVVATGINGIETLSPHQENFILIPEVVDHELTLRQASELKETGRRCFVIVDSTVTGQAIMTEVKAIESRLRERLDFYYVDELSFEELMGFVGLLNHDDIIYLLPYFRDAAGNTFPQGNVATSLAAVAPSPIFVSYEFQLDTGAFGGAVTSGFSLGERAAAIVLELFQGVHFPALVRLENGSAINMYDYQVAQRLGIDMGFLPPDTHYINRPPSFLVKHREVLIPSMGVVGILTLFLLMILKMLKKETIINRSNQLIIRLKQEVIDTQRELVATLGEVIETRSQETGHHVQRVAKISRLIGSRLGLDERDLDLLEAASPLHDVGKIGIADNILNRPGTLNSEEILKMQQHTTIGKDILGSSDRELLAAACAIAYQHHERWDGTGYPEGLRGESIHLFARITAVADVYDALSSERCYKSAWQEERVLNYLEKERGAFFDPQIIDVFMQSYPEIKQIRDALAE